MHIFFFSPSLYFSFEGLFLEDLYISVYCSGHRFDNGLGMFQGANSSPWYFEFENFFIDYETVRTIDQYTVSLYFEIKRKSDLILRILKII